MVILIYQVVGFLLDLTIADKKRTLKEKIIINKIKIISYLSLILFGFIIGRTVILDFLNPFSIALLCASMINGANVLIVSLSLLFGVFSLKNSEMLLWHIFTIATLLVIYFFIYRTRIKKRIFFSILGPVISFTTSFFVFYVKDYYLYDMLMLFIESIMICALTNIYDKGLLLLTGHRQRKVLSTEEMVSASIFIASLFLGSSVFIWKLSVKNIISIFLILLFSYVGNIGVGAVSGTILGVLHSLSGDIYSSAIGVYSICGLLSASLKNFGRLAMVFGFILGNSIMTFYINGSTEVLIKFNEILTASALFLIFPEKYLKKIFCFQDCFGSNTYGKRSEKDRFKDYTVERLNEVSDVFRELSISMNEGLNGKSYFSQLDAAEIIDKVTKEVCSSCGMYNSCWKKDFYRKYQILFDILSLIESNKGIGDKDRDITGEKCLFPDKVWNSLKYNYDIYKSSHMWKKKWDEGRTALSHQLGETSKLISKLADRLDFNLEFCNDIEEQIHAHLDSIRVHVQDVSVAKLKNSMEIEIRLKNCGGKRECIKNILPEIRKITDKNFVKTDMMCHVVKNDLCCLKMREAHKFSVATGFTRRLKESGSISGDNYSLIELKDGKFFMILSDGMGSGPRAALESSLAVNLLEKFLFAGYDQNAALEAINSLLLIKSDDENYATLDISVINQYTGEVEFLKVGAVSTFIKYRDRVDIIRNSSLPAGILNKIDVEFNRRKLNDGDFVIMVTDGILDSNKKDLDKEKWLAELIYEIDTRNPQKIADSIMESCLLKSRGQVVDDMTILVAKVWKFSH